MSDPEAVILGTFPVAEDDARRAARYAIEGSPADEVEVLISGSTSGVTRYASSQIIQNTVRNEIRAGVRVVVGDRSAVAGTNQLDSAHMREVAARAVEAARASVPDADFPGLPRPEEVGQPERVLRWDEATVAADPRRRASAVAEILGVTGATSAAGVYETSAHAFGVFSSTGVDCFDAYSRCIATCLADNGDATGWAQASSHAIDEVDVASIAARALGKAERGRGAVDAEPGTYEVVLEAPAVAEMLDYFAYVGFGAKQMIEGDSFLATRSGDKVAGEAVTVSDDVFHPLSVGIGFDLEGVPKRRVPVIEGGIAKGPVTDLRTGRKLGAPSSGHFSGSNEFGPYAFNVVLEPGDLSIEELVAGVDRGFLVTRFHYVNVLDRHSTLLTGMTRDGTFRISGGEIAEPVHNFRFAQNVLDALSSATGIGREAASFGPDWGSFGSTVAPALRVGEFRFASKTSH